MATDDVHMPGRVDLCVAWSVMLNTCNIPMLWTCNVNPWYLTMSMSFTPNALHCVKVPCSITYRHVAPDAPCCRVAPYVYDGMTPNTTHPVRTPSTLSTSSPAMDSLLQYSGLYQTDWTASGPGLRTTDESTIFTNLSALFHTGCFTRNVHVQH